MKALSAAIIVLSGSIIFSIGSLVGHGGTQLFVMITGGLVGLIGLAHWWGLVHRPPSEL